MLTDLKIRPARSISEIKIIAGLNIEHGNQASRNGSNQTSMLPVNPCYKIINSHDIHRLQVGGGGEQGKNIYFYTRIKTTPSRRAREMISGSTFEQTITAQVSPGKEISEVDKSR